MKLELNVIHMYIIRVQKNAICCIWDLILEYDFCWYHY